MHHFVSEVIAVSFGSSMIIEAFNVQLNCQAVHVLHVVALEHRHALELKQTLRLPPLLIFEGN